MLGRRLASAAVIITVVIGLMIGDYQLGTEANLGRPGLILGALAILIAVMSCHELVYLGRQHFPKLNLPFHLIVSGIAVAISCAPILWRDYPVDCAIGLFGWQMMALTWAAGMTSLFEILNYSDDGKGTARIGFSVLIYLQLVLLFGFLIAHRLLFDENGVGIFAMVTLITTVKMSDAAAYFFGKSFGKHKLAPKLSPGKTIEGCVGSFVGALAGSSLILFAIVPLLFETDLTFPIWWLIAYSVLITVAAIIGDLTESMLKRDAKIKDSSSWLPGLGGVLDITDSLVLAAPVSYFMWVMLK